MDVDTYKSLFASIIIRRHNTVRGKISRKILANLANGKPFAKIFPPNIFNLPNRIPEQNCNMLKYFKPKQRHEDNDDEVKPKVFRILMVI